MLAGMSAADDILDLSQILAAFGEIDDDVREMLQLFIDTTAPMLDALEAQAASHDQSGLEDNAHSVKGAARSAGARAMAQTAEALEAAARAGDWDQVDVNLKAIRPAFAAARDAIARL